MKKEDINNVLGETFDKEEIPEYPGRIFWRKGDDFFTKFPMAPVIFAEVRFRETNASQNGDFIVHEARWIDTSNPENSHGEWETHELDI